MPTITFENQQYEIRPDESILNGLLRQGGEITFSCGKGSCRVCLQRCKDGPVPLDAQRGIKSELTEKGYFLPCICFPTDAMTIEPPRPEDLSFAAEVVSKERLSPSVLKLLLEPEIDFSYRAGQFVNITHDNGLIRSYSLASVHGEEPYIELHIQIVPGGAMSERLQNDVDIGEPLNLSGPFGENFYRVAEATHKLVLIGTGTGLSPIYGIAKNAIYAGHDGPIHLYHAGVSSVDLYLHKTLLKLSTENRTFHYHPYAEVPAGNIGAIFKKANLPDVAFKDGIRDARIHVAGQPETINRCFVVARQYDVSPAMIVVDSFVSNDSELSTSLESGQTSEQITSCCEIGPRRFTADPEMWDALGNGRLLRKILSDFYSRAFEDPVLSPYFHDVSRQRLVEKVYSYLRQAFTGERYYFGNHPKNAHHWMVIDDEIFDYRERLLVECIRRHNLPEHLVQRWNSLEEQFRGDIVKRKPQGRIVGGKELPVSGFGEETLAYSSLCDGCASELLVGEVVRYHLRLGKTYGKCCNDDRLSADAI